MNFMMIIILPALFSFLLLPVQGQQSQLQREQRMAPLFCSNAYCNNYECVLCGGGYCDIFGLCVCAIKGSPQTAHKGAVRTPAAHTRPPSMSLLPAMVYLRLLP